MTSYRFWVDRGVTPTTTVTSTNVFCIGYSFTVNSAAWLTELYVYRTSSTGNPTAIGLVHESGAGSVVLNIVPTTLSGTGWQPCGLSTPFQFVTGDSYAVMANFPNGTTYVDTASFFTGSNSFTDGPITVSGATNTGLYGLYTDPATIVVPTNNSTTWWGLDIGYTDVNPSGTTITLGLASGANTAYGLAIAKSALVPVGTTVRGW